MDTSEKTRELIGLFIALGLTRAYAKHLACNYMQAYVCEPKPPPLLPFLERERVSFPDEWPKGVGPRLCYAYASRLVESWGEG